MIADAFRTIDEAKVHIPFGFYGLHAKRARAASNRRGPLTGGGRLYA